MDATQDETTWQAPADETLFALVESGRTISYGELCRGVEPGLLPCDDAGYQHFLDIMGAMEIG